MVGELRRRRGGSRAVGRVLRGRPPAVDGVARDPCRRRGMTRASYSAVIPAPVDDVWAIARDFGNYRLFTHGRGESFVEDGRSGDSVGAIRNATLDGRTVRQRLLSHSD